MSYRRRRYSDEERRYEGEPPRDRDLEGASYGDREYIREERAVRAEGRYRRERKQEERSVEFLTLGAVLLTVVLFVANATLVAFLGGAIFTLSGIYQASRRWRVNPLTWVGGIGMLMVGLLGVQSGGLSVVFPVLIFAGVILGSVAPGEL
ncbi:MAG TPA: hypothetical protein VMT34_17720 [Aggregatilineales bacterium]|nr:hypothetical protein [Aggregatilineales bacterium]